jgi:hypothetical protein
MHVLMTSSLSFAPVSTSVMATVGTGGGGRVRIFVLYHRYMSSEITSYVRLSLAH